MIKYPVRVEQGPDETVPHIRDASDRVLDLDEIVDALNAKAEPRRRTKRRPLAEELRDSDVLAQTAERTDIVYGHYSELPQGGEHVARLGRKAR